MRRHLPPVTARTRLRIGVRTLSFRLELPLEGLTFRKEASSHTVKETERVTVLFVVPK